MYKQPAESAPSPKTRAKKQKCQKSSARGNYKTAPKMQAGKNNKCTCFASRQ
jgi:hypothetical protein